MIIPLKKGIRSRFANIGQILGLKNVKSAFAVLTLGSIWQTGTWFFGSNVRIDLGQWWLAVAALCFLVYLWLILRPENLIRNPRFAAAGDRHDSGRTTGAPAPESAVRRSRWGGTRPRLLRTKVRSEREP